MNTITTLIPQYGELNRISKDWIVSHTSLLKSRNSSLISTRNGAI